MPDSNTLYEQLMMLLVHFTPFLIGLGAFLLVALAAWTRPPRTVRILCGVLGAALLLGAIWYFILRPLLN